MALRLPPASPSGDELLSLVGLAGPGADSVPTFVAVGGGVTIAAGQASSSGNNTLITPAAGKTLRLFYVSYNPLADAEVGFRFGAAGTIWLRNNVLANSVIAKDLNFGRYLQGAVDEALILNLSVGTVTNWTVFYVEV